MLGGIALTLFCLWFSQNNHLLPVPASANAGAIDSLFNAMLTIALGLFVLVQGVLIYAGIRFRKRPGDETDGPPIRGNIPLEILWTSIPAVLVLGIALYSFEIYSEMGGLDPMASGGTMVAHNHGSHGGMAIAATMGEDSAADALMDLDSKGKALAYGVGAGRDEAASADLDVDVMGLQYAWIFTYPDTGIVSGELHVPVDKAVQLNIKAQDVLHAFWIPQFRLKQDAIPGQQTSLRFKPTVTGRYPIVCAELCGAYHGAMRAEVVVDSPEDYDTWQASMVAAVDPANKVTLAAATEDFQALNPKTMSDRDFLEPYGSEMGVTSQSFQGLPHHHLH
ncbi:MAG: cytochrome c oxidase subunit II [Cyanophyceae cyanobacterium]